MKLPTAVLASWTRRSLHTRVVQRIVREPEYLDSAGPKTPVYGPLNIRLTSYDFPVLENFSGYVHKTAENLGFTVEECWPAPATKMEVNLLKQPNQTQQPEGRYLLKSYKRVVQVSGATTTRLPLLLEVIQTALPTGMQLKVEPHSDAYTEERYVPDQELLQLKDQLIEMGGPSIASMKKKR